MRCDPTPIVQPHVRWVWIPVWLRLVIYTGMSLTSEHELAEWEADFERSARASLIVFAQGEAEDVRIVTAWTAEFGWTQEPVPACEEAGNNAA